MRTMLFVASLTLLCASSTFAQESGDRIVVTAATARLKSRNDIVGSVPRGDILTVKDVDIDWFWVIYSGAKATTKGWIKRRDVIPLEMSLEYFNDEIRRSPDASLYNIRGKIWNDKQNIKAALDDWNESIRLDPTQAEPWGNRAKAWCKLGDYDHALADCNEAIRLDPKNVSAYIVRGIVWKKKGDDGKALADGDEAIRLDPKNALAFNNRGIQWEHNGDRNKAIADFTEAIRLDSKWASPYISRGIACLENRDYDRAIADFEEAIRIDPLTRFSYYRTYSYHERAYACFKNGDYAKSIADWNVCLRLDPDDISALRNLADIFAACPNDEYRDGKRAVELATKAGDFCDWIDADLIDTLASAFAERGEFENAVEWQEKALGRTLETDKDRYRSRLSRLDLYKTGKPYRFKPTN
jgi:tetratricopeptide (TPR) repeat protein